MFLTLVVFPIGSITTLSPFFTFPCVQFPLTTVPHPFTMKAESTTIRRGFLLLSSKASLACFLSSSLSSPRPSPVTAETFTIGSERVFSFNRSSTSLKDSSRRLLSQISTLVRATTPLLMPKLLAIRRCSRVWGITPSEASTTRSTPETQQSPATAFLIYLSCPGTSISSRRRLSWGKSRKAKPISTVNPLFFSSGRRSVSIPVSFFTRVVFPWSVCPAVAKRTYLIKDRSEPLWQRIWQGLCPPYQYLPPLQSHTPHSLFSLQGI